MRVRYSFSSRRTRTIDAHNDHRQAFPRLVREMVDKCDIILEVIDSRYIDETRNLALETMVKSKGKRIIYILNKADLVNKEEKKKEIEQKQLYPFVFLSCKERKGISELRERIKIETSRLETKFPKTNIGVIGYPNTGKSTLINLLVGRASARTAAEAGFTKGIQKLKLSENAYIIDTPGVIPESKYSMIDNKKITQHTIVSARNWDKVKAPESVVDSLAKENPGLFEQFYNIDAENSEVLIEKLGRKKSFLTKGNQVDIDRTARLILKDWQTGKIKKN